MDFIDQLTTLASRIRKTRTIVQTEEATKNAYILPFIQALGYDVFNPEEVIPEYTADYGLKKGEKVDYAIRLNGEIVMLFECKKCDSHLDSSCASQLFRYFSVEKARIGVLTDGITYQFYSDLDERNKMDQRPFMELNLLEIQDSVVPELKLLAKSTFDLDLAISSASELKYTREIRRIFAEQLTTPSDDFVRLFASHIHSGKVTQRVIDQFRDMVRRAMHMHINDKVNERLNKAAALSGSDSPDIVAPDPVEEEVDEPSDGVVTTEEEWEGYHLVKSILREVIDPARIAHRDTMSYMGILLDDNNRRPICRLHFNRDQKYIGLFDENKNETRMPITEINDIYQHAEHLKITALRYDGVNVVATPAPVSPVSDN